MLEKTLIEAVEETANDKGWANLADVGNYLRSKEVNYGKLSRFLVQYENVVETYLDTTIDPPIKYVKLKDA